jgi:hypothetical protein
MSFTTPPRPIDIAAVFPDLREHACTATRLHPRPGSPTLVDSSVGGPFLWPAGELWPVCEESHQDADAPQSLSRERRRRQVLTAARARTPQGHRLQLTDEEHALVDYGPPVDYGVPIRVSVDPGPLPMLGIAQLYARDVPDFKGPEGTDLLQVLWCPFDHGDLCCPAVVLKWRRAADVTDVLADQPEPPAMEYEYLPEPCVLHPEQVTEYPYGGLLPAGLDQRIQQWESDAGPSYQYELSIANGWKVGGWSSWSLTDPYPMVCDCGQDLELLLTIASSEWDRGESWRPLEDLDTGFHGCSPTQVTIGRGYSLWIFICPASFDHPHQMSMQ